MPPDSSPYGRPRTSTANCPSPVIDLEECIRQEMLRQAGIAPDVPQLPYLKTELLLHQKKNLRRMIDLENGGHSILQMDAIGMGKTLQSLCLILSSLDRRARSPVPGSFNSYPAPVKPRSRTRWEDTRKSTRRKESQVDVQLSWATLIVVQKANLGHWADEIGKHMDLPEGYLTIQDAENPKTAQEFVNARCRIVLVSRETITELYEEAAAGHSVWLFEMRFVRLILDEGGSSTGKAEKTRHALMIQSIHADSKVLVDATPYDQGSSHRSKLRKLRELGATRSFFSSTRNYDALETQWENRVVQAKEGAELATQLVQQFLQDHLVRSQEADRPEIRLEERHEVALKFNKPQAFAYNRLLSAQALAFLSSAEALSSDVRVEEFFRHLTDTCMCTCSYDLMCNPAGLLADFNIESLLASPAFHNGNADFKTARVLWDAFTQNLTSAGVSQQRLADISALLCLHKEDKAESEGIRILRACVLCKKDSFLPIVAPTCGHVLCVQCLLRQKTAQQPGSSSARIYEKRDWSKEALDRLAFECACKRAFSMGELCAGPTVCFIPHGLSIDGSPKLQYLLRFVKEHPQEKTLIYLTDKRHRVFIANYFHSQLIPLADFSHSGAQENKKDQAELAGLKERFKRPAGAAPVAGDASPPVFVALAAGASASSSVRGLDLHMLHHILIVEPHLDDRVEKQLIGRGRRIGQMGRLQEGQ